MSTSELICAPKPFILDTTEIKLDAKIKTDDLLDAVLFEKEDELVSTLSALEKEKNKLTEKCQSLTEEINKLVENLSKTFKSKEAEDCIKVLKKFTGNEYVYSIDIVPYDYGMPGKTRIFDTDLKKDVYLPINKLGIIIKINNDDGYSRNKFERSYTIDTPKNLASKYKERNSLKAREDECIKLCEEIHSQINNLSFIKKRIKASFIKTLIKGNVRTNEELLYALRDELDLQITKKPVKK